MHAFFDLLKSRAFAAVLVLAGIAALALGPTESFGAAVSRSVGTFAAAVAEKAGVPAPAHQTALAAPEAYEQAVIDTTERSLKAVVAIVATKDVQVVGQCAERNGRITYIVPCPQGTQTREVGGGSGFFVSSDGLILTNKHVVDDPNASYTVFTTDGRKYPATVKRIDDQEDLAVIQVRQDGFPTLPLGDSDAVRLAQTAIAIGNALGQFNNTVSVGVISGLNRTVTATDRAGGTESLKGMIQTDTPINAGNSGGPLLNLQGQVIGITTAVASNAQSIGFALPSNRAKALIAAVRSGQAASGFDRLREALTVLRTRTGSSPGPVTSS